MDNWCALYVKTYTEQDIAEAIETRFGKLAFVPLEYRLERRGDKLRPVTHLYMPGYVFLTVPESPEEYYDIRMLPGVFRFLGGGIPERIPTDQMRFLLGLTAQGTGDEYAQVRKTPEGEHILTGGPLADLHPRIVKYNARQQRATIEVQLLDRTHRVTITALDNNQPVQGGA